jgi:hypothetical protein
MQAVSDLIDFLMSLMRDDKTRTAFEQDPKGTLARHNLSGVTGQDVRDARLVMADGGGVRCTDHGWSGSHHDDAVREIHHTTEHFEVHDETFNFVSIDDRDTVINDSFNDSFNSQDNNEINTVAVQDNDTNNINLPTVDTPAPEPVHQPEPEPVEDPLEAHVDDPVDEDPIHEPAGPEPVEDAPLHADHDPELDHHDLDHDPGHDAAVL